jgi:O-antigen ligase
LAKAWGLAEGGLWAVFALLLPITSFPAVVRLSGADMVAPAVGPLLVLLLAASVLPRWVKGERLPKAAQPLLAFFCAALVSCIFALYVEIPPFRDQPYLKNELKAVLTLVVGVSFFLASATWNADEKRAARFLRWVDYGGLATVAWALAQGVAWRLWQAYPDWMQNLHSLISIHALYRAQATGLAFEPSWLAHQLNLLYFPFWAAAALRGTSVHRLRWRFVTVERVLLGAGLVALIFSVSRVGLVAPLLCVLLLAGMGAWRLVMWVQRRALRRVPQGFLRRLAGGLVGLGVLAALLAAALGLFVGAGYGLSRYDKRMRSVFNLSILRNNSFARYANQLVFAERFIYWQTGWEIFNDHPIFGVGLGNAGYFFPTRLSAYAWQLTEVRTLMYHLNIIPNIKNLWVRLLAETGLVGTAFFLCWLYLALVSALALFRRGGLAGTVGLAGLFVLLGLLPEGFSVDTFALPYFWISLGIVTALASRSTAGRERHPEDI